VPEARVAALSLYRRILRAGRAWPEASEREYIRNEAHALFAANRALRDPEEVKKKLFEGESRLALAIHYKIPYPRL
jgi:hypothetical protein